MPTPLRLLVATLVLCTVMSGKSRFEGTWEGKDHDLPSISVTLKEDRGTMTGSIILFFVARGEDGKYHVTRQQSMELASVKGEGAALSLQVDPQTGNDHNLQFRMDLTGKNSALLHYANFSQDSPPVKLTRK